MQWGTGGRVWSFSPFLGYAALRNWKEAHTCLAKLIGSLGVGTLTNSSHQAGAPLGRHTTSPTLGGHQRVAWALQNDWAHALLSPGGSAPDRNSHRCGSKAGRPPKSPPTDWDQSTVSSELLDNENQSSPSTGFVRSTVSVVLFASLDGEGQWCPSTGHDLSANLRGISRLESKFGSLKVTLCLVSPGWVKQPTYCLCLPAKLPAFHDSYATFSS